MKRTAAETAHILSALYDETFGRDSFEPFRITWPQLRSLAAVRRLNDTFLKDVSEELSESERCLIPFNEFLLVTGQQDLSHYTAQEVATWRATLDHFDAVKIGLPHDWEICSPRCCHGVA
jgi:hypothetical protein